MKITKNQQLTVKMGEKSFLSLLKNSIKLVSDWLNNERYKILLGIFLILASSRLIPHPPNFTSLIALSFYVPLFFDWD